MGKNNDSNSLGTKTLSITTLSSIWIFSDKCFTNLVKWYDHMTIFNIFIQYTSTSVYPSWPLFSSIFLFVTHHSIVWDKETKKNAHLQSHTQTHWFNVNLKRIEMINKRVEENGSFYYCHRKQTCSCISCTYIPSPLRSSWRSQISPQYLSQSVGCLCASLSISQC